MAGTEVTLSAQGREAIIWSIVQQVAASERESVRKAAADRAYLLALIREVADAIDRKG
jgi:hypothetical protein